jgi:hypothetical protein
MTIYATYDPSGLATSALYRVRFHIGDTDTDAALLGDDEINYILGVNGDDVEVSIVALARSLLMRYGTQPKSVRLPDGTSADFSDRVAIWNDLIARLDTASTGLRIRRIARPQAVGGGEYT